MREYLNSKKKKEASAAAGASIPAAQPLGTASQNEQTGDDFAGRCGPAGSLASPAALAWASPPGGQAVAAAAPACSPLRKDLFETPRPAKCALGEMRRQPTAGYKEGGGASAARQLLTTMDDVLFY